MPHPSAPLYNFYLQTLQKSSSINDFLQPYLQTPTLRRLRHIGCFCGMDYASPHVYHFAEYINRFDHSLTTALLTARFTTDRAAILAALFHDAATPCFSHVIDYVHHDAVRQESTESSLPAIITSDPQLLTLLHRDRIDVQNVINFKRYSLVDSPRPHLCADRLDGLIASSIAWSQRLKKPRSIQQILQGLHAVTNDQGLLEIGATKTCRDHILALNDYLNTNCYTFVNTYMMQLLADIVQLALEEKIITEQNLYSLSEQKLITLFQAKSTGHLRQLLDHFFHVSPEQIPNTTPAVTKKHDLRVLTI